MRVVIPEVADYEVRRSLILSNLTTSLVELDARSSVMEYRPITTPTMRRAAVMWADARRQGVPTGHHHSLDCDVIVAAEAMEIGGVVVTENVGHMSRYVPTLEWRSLLQHLAP